MKLIVSEMAISFSTLSALVFACLATCSVAATTKSGRALRDAVFVEGSFSHQSSVLDEAASVVTTDSSEIKLVTSMDVLLHSKDQDEDPTSPKAELQRKLVALIWLERVLQQNIDSMDEATYEDKIAKNKAKLVKDTSPATASMLGSMRTELHQFAVPFYEKAVQDEMKRLRERQKVLLDQLIALDAKDGAEPDKPAADAGEPKKAEITEDCVDCEEKNEKKKEPTAAEKAAKQARRDQSNMMIGIMSGIAGVLLAIVVGTAFVVKNHVGDM